MKLHRDTSDGKHHHHTSPRGAAGRHDCTFIGPPRIFLRQPRCDFSTAKRGRGTPCQAAYSSSRSWGKCTKTAAMAAAPAAPISLNRKLPGETTQRPPPHACTDRQHGNSDSTTPMTVAARSTRQHYDHTGTLHTARKRTSISAAGASEPGPQLSRSRPRHRFGETQTCTPNDHHSTCEREPTQFLVLMQPTRKKVKESRPSATRANKNTLPNNLLQLPQLRHVVQCRSHFGRARITNAVQPEAAPRHHAAQRPPHKPQHWSPTAGHHAHSSTTPSSGALFLQHR